MVKKINCLEDNCIARLYCLRTENILNIIYVYIKRYFVYKRQPQSSRGEAMDSIKSF